MRLWAHRPAVMVCWQVMAHMHLGCWQAVCEYRPIVWVTRHAGLTSFAGSGRRGARGPGDLHAPGRGLAGRLGGAAELPRA